MRGRAGSALRVHHELQLRPFATIARLSKATMLSVPTITSALLELERIGIVREVTGQKRNQIFWYEPYVRILSEGT